MSFSIASAVTKAIAPLTGGVGKELSAYVGDQIRFLRWKSAVRILQRAKVFCRQEGIRPKQVPIKFIVPFLEAASFEDVDSDKELADMWASLFASAVSQYQARHAVYIDILRKLSSTDAMFVRELHKKLQKDDLYSDDSFDPDIWNIDDKHIQIESFCESFKEQGPSILKSYRRDGLTMPGPRDPLNRMMKKCVEHPIRSDILPLAYNLGLYQEEGWTNGTSDLFIQPYSRFESVFNLISLNLMEKFDAAAWYPKPHSAGDWAVRATCSFATLTSLGLDFMKSCIPKQRKRRKK